MTKATEQGRGMRAAGYAAIGLSLIAALSACSRDKTPLTACAGGKPVVERTLDVAPPNC
ncbi:hypothetical protein [Defluviimonas salinarum]|uniref:Lipoprotein n=1 Tax=Defluviimonas salinarum TaxID=2992147 RepID=A0ABT3J0M4_9RHOB|nr:hypothetical protein [Defluviimonas salinarum]MCW3781229.1 hypothetical protein [Defluviimonas salinarum]